MQTTINREEVKIIEIRSNLKAGQKPVKQLTYSGMQYTYPVIYVLEDGRTIETTSGKRLLRDAKTDIANMPYVPSAMSAKFSDGEYWGTVSRMTLF